MIKCSLQLTVWVSVLLLLASIQNVAGKDMRSLYDDATLQYWQQRYQRGIKRNLDVVIWPRLKAVERRKLANVQRTLPLRDSDNDPFTFYATTRPPTVTISVLSLKFFDDLSLALAWLQLNRLSIETPFEYVAMLKYKDAAALGGRYPPPLAALRIPRNARQDANVNRLAAKIFDSAIAFILLHELGHLFYGHRGYGPDVPRADARQNEMAADRFALEIMRRTSTQPTGMALFFQVLAHGTETRGDYQSDDAFEAALARATHPVTEDRVRALATFLRKSARDFTRLAPNPAREITNINFIAEQLVAVADHLGDRELQRFIARIGRTTTPAMLRPRRPGESAAPELVPVPQTADDLPRFHGPYVGTIGLPDGSVNIKTFLRRQGDRVKGEYYYGAGQGRLDGRVQDEALFFTWREGREQGRGIFRPSRGDEAFTGSWGFGTSSINGGSWTGTRQRR